MDLVTITSDELNTLRKNDIIFDPNTEKIYEFRSREGKAMFVREIGQEKINKILKNTMKNVLKVSSLQNYQLISIQDDSLTLFNSNSGESFDLGFGDQSAEDIEKIKKEFYKGSEINAEIFEYEDINVVIKLNILSQDKQESKNNREPIGKSSDKELKLAKEIEKRKENKRPFSEFQPEEAKPQKSKSKAKKTTKKEKKIAKKPRKKTASKSPKKKKATKK